MQQWVKWVLGIVATVIAAGVVTMAGTISAHGEDIAVSKSRIDGIEKTIQSIDRKLDRLILMEVRRDGRRNPDSP